MRGREFERLIYDRIKSLNALGPMYGGRYGVQVSYQPRTSNGATVMTPIPISSLPDFEGAIPPLGRNFSFDAKVCSVAKLDLQSYIPGDGKKASRERQLNHLLERSKTGAACFLLIHFPLRQLITKCDPVQTWAFPVGDTPFWREALALRVRSINREDCQTHGILVPWTRLNRDRTLRPDVLSAINRLFQENRDGEESR